MGSDKGFMDPTPFYNLLTRGYVTEGMAMYVTVCNDEQE